MRRIDWQTVRRDLLRGFIAWGIIDLIFYSRAYVSYATQVNAVVTWGDAWLRALVEEVVNLL
ncbi:MAG TPA: hypothetical protein VEQ60_14930, partial [Longimicrobium sp.]|nr:hypothetical protein [Longimicrobium sp.]